MQGGKKMKHKRGRARDASNAIITYFDYHGQFAQPIFQEETWTAYPRI